MVWSAPAHLFTVLLALICNGRHSDKEKDLELLILQHQLNILVRKQKTAIKATRAEKLTLAVLAATLKTRTRRPVRQMAHLIRLFQPETVLKWHRELGRRKWTYRRQNKGGRPPIDLEIEVLIVRLATENRRWGYGKIQGKLHKLGFKVPKSTIRIVLNRKGIKPGPARGHSVGWNHLMNHYKEQILACDFFTLETIGFHTLYVFFFIELGSRRVHLLIFNRTHLRRVLNAFVEYWFIALLEFKSAGIGKKARAAPQRRKWRRIEPGVKLIYASSLFIRSRFWCPSSVQNRSKKV